MGEQDQTLANLQNLDPAIAEKAVQLVNTLRLSGLPAVIRASGGRRSLAEQLRLYAKGRITAGPKVTNTVYGSKHLQGKAFDIGFLGFTADDLEAANRNAWRIIGTYAESIGLKWGGRWTQFTDKPHFYI